MFNNKKDVINYHIPYYLNNWKELIKVKLLLLINK